MNKMNHPCLIQVEKYYKNNKCPFIDVPNHINSGSYYRFFHLSNCIPYEKFQR